MSHTINPASRFFIVLRPDSNGDVVGRFDVPGDTPVQIGKESDATGDLHVVELNGRSDLANYPLDVREDWFTL